MNLFKRKRIVIFIAVTLNVALIGCVLMSVITAFNDAERVSFSQNIENARTLTNSSANKVELEIDHYTQEIITISGYVNDYNGVGMTQEELCDFFEAYYAKKSEDFSWELASSELNGIVGAGSGFPAIALCNKDESSFIYKSQIYTELSKIFCAAAESNMGKVRYTNEFTDASADLAKVSAITTTIRLRQEGGYQYKTLMLLVKSKNINALISDNNEIDNLSFFDYSNIIVDNDGNYVISSSQFQGTNFTDYIELYNDDFTAQDSKALCERLRGEDYSDVLYYKNSRGQDCAYTIVPVQDSDWHVLSIVPVESFHNTNDYNKSFSNFAISFGFLFLVDIVFVLIINRQLRRRTKEAQAANIAKSEFLSSMSHDIRTPMNAIIGMTLIADENLKEEPDLETLKDCIKTIQLSGNHLLTLINDILDISKIENGKVVLAPDDFSISESIGKMLEIVQPQIREKNFEFETHIINVNHEFVHADELRINQVYINILSNAIKYTNPGGKITVDFIEEELPGKENCARFIYRVTDTGIGMAPEFLKTIFDRFSRAVDTRVNTTQGTGLGMAISKRLVDIMGGTITAESTINVGSTFTVTLELPVADVRTQNVSLKGRRALLIDDDSILLTTAEIALKKSDMEVDTAKNGDEGLKLAEAHSQQGTPYDVVLVDWKMSGMDGLHVVKALRSGPCRDTKILVMTAYNIADVEHEARQSGADGLVSKPLFQSKLLHTIQTVLSDSVSPVAPAEKKTFNLRVLVAEDNNTNWKVLSKLLTRYGVEADRAENGSQAVEAVANDAKDYDLVLMDIQMPVMNGYEAAKAIRRLDNKKKAATPIYAMTADTFAEDVTRSLASGMDGHLAKPVEIDKLVKVLALISERTIENDEGKQRL